MEKDFRIRPFAPEDRESCLELYNHVFPKKVKMSFWNWLYEENTAGKSFIETAWAGNKLIGLYGIVQMSMSAGGSAYKGALSATAVTRPEYRYRGVFSALGKEVYRRAEEDGIIAVYGFPTDHSRHGFQKSLGWNCITQGKALINSISGDMAPARARLYRLNSAEKELDLIWKRISGGPFRNAALTIRDCKYLEWRFFKHPEKKYSLILAEDDSGPAGYVAASVKVDFGEECCEVEDIIASDVHCFRELISYAGKKISSGGLVRIILPEESPFYRCVVGMGFRETGAKYYFGWKGLKNTTAFSGEWYYTIADSADTQY
ncbi:MAG: GNAT family N-acetyltransferase [Bacillota bacterium]